MYERGKAILFVLSRLTSFIVIFKTEFAVIHSVVQHNNSAALSFTSVSAPAVTDGPPPTSSGNLIIFKALISES